MRKQLCEALLSRSIHQDMVFLTGDLGFMALEPLQSAMGSRFINAGIAEQNMVSVAAALSRQELDVWVYSIAPFCYARPFEQIRNDVAFHGLPVKLIGNGGGYGYGVMGPTHHAIEDYGVLLSLSGMRVFVPVFDEDVPAVIERAAHSQSPAYIRIGRGEPPQNFTIPAYAPWRQLISGGGAVVIVVGPLAGIYIDSLQSLPVELRPNLWVIAELPLEINPPPPELLKQIDEKQKLCIAEEHVKQAGFGSQFSLFLLHECIAVRKFCHLYARAHHYDRYGSQSYLRQRSGLDAVSMLSALENMTDV